MYQQHKVKCSATEKGHADVVYYEIITEKKDMVTILWKQEFYVQESVHVLKSSQSHDWLEEMLSFITILFVCESVQFEILGMSLYK